MQTEQFYYDNQIVKKFINATIFWGLIGMSVGLLLAFMFLFPNLTDGISWLSFGRLRPLHTNAVIFAFVGNAINKHLWCLALLVKHHCIAGYIVFLGIALHAMAIVF